MDDKLYCFMVKSPSSAEIFSTVPDKSFTKKKSFNSSLVIESFRSNRNWPQRSPMSPVETCAPIVLTMAKAPGVSEKALISDRVPVTGFKDSPGSSSSSRSLTPIKMCHTQQKVLHVRVSNPHPPRRRGVRSWFPS